VEDPHDNIENYVNEGNCKEEGGEEDGLDLKDEVAYHGGADGLEQDDQIVREENVYCE